MNAYDSGYRSGYLIAIECCYYVNITEYMIQNTSDKSNNVINLVNAKAKLLLNNISNLPDDEMEDYEDALSGIRSLCNQCNFNGTRINILSSKIMSSNDDSNSSAKSLDW